MLPDDSQPELSQPVSERLTDSNENEGHVSIVAEVGIKLDNTVLLNVH